jgi:DNA-binding transcriptional LysR family regulator
MLMPSGVDERTRGFQCRLDLACDHDVRGRRSEGKLIGVSLAQIEYFVAVAEERHVGRAAKKLRIAQPAVSRQIRKLEDELKASLFMRTARGMCLSDAGAVFLQHAREILGGIDAARGAVLRAAPTRPT